MNWYTFRLLQLHKMEVSLLERRREMFASVAYPKAVEYKAAVVQSSTRGGSEVLDYVIRAEELDSRISEIRAEMAEIRMLLDAHQDILTPMERTVVVLRFYECKSWPTIAKQIYGEITEANIYKARKLKRNAEKKLNEEFLHLDER